MITLNLKGHCKARIWVKRNLDFSFTPSEILTETYSKIDKTWHVNDSYIAVELSVPVGARIIYGMLGAEFKSNQSNSFLLEINSSDVTKTILKTPLYHGIDDVFIALPDIYTNSIKREVERCFEGKLFPPGKMKIDCAAYSEVGSNKKIFDDLVVIICNYFFSGKDFKSDDDYLDLFLLHNS
jgi:hypothetical protein